jgi:hypothetical protein
MVVGDGLNFWEQNWERPMLFMVPIPVPTGNKIQEFPIDKGICSE